MNYCAINSFGAFGRSELKLVQRMICNVRPGLESNNSSFINNAEFLRKIKDHGWLWESIFLILDK